MWKRIDNDFYNTLIAAHRYDYAPDYFTFPFIFLLLELMIAVPVFIYGQYPPMFIPVSALVLLITVIFFIIGIVYLVKKSNIKKRIQESNNAAYHPATLVSKYSRTAGNTNSGDANIFVGVRLNGRNMKVRTRKDVYSLCNIGDSIYVVDLIGENAASQYTCIAVMDIPQKVNYDNSYNNGYNNSYNNGYNDSYGNDLNSGYQQQNYGMQYENTMKYSENDTRITGRAITGEERKKFIKEENKNLLKYKFLAAMFGIIAAGLLIVLITLNKEMNSSLERLVKLVMTLSGVFFAVSFLVLLVNILLCRDITERLRYGNIRVEDVMIRNIDTTHYRSGKIVYHHYYYNCVSDKGRVFVVDSRTKYRVSQGSRAVVVYFGDNDDKPSIYKK